MADIQVLLDELEPALGAVTTAPRALDGGFTNRNYRVGLGGDDYVVRICGKDTGVLGIDRDNEREATRIAAELGIGPEVVAFLSERACLVTRFVSGAPLGDGELRTEPVLAQAGRLLRTLHDGPPFPATFNGFTVAAEHLEAMLERGGTQPPQYAAADAVAQRIRAALHGGEHELVPCHNDLLAGNLLQAGDRLMLVDWEYAGMNDRFFDLANLAVNNGLDPDDEARLLEAYFGEPPSAAPPRRAVADADHQRLPRGDVGRAPGRGRRNRDGLHGLRRQALRAAAGGGRRPALRTGPACRGRVTFPTARAW